LSAVFVWALVGCTATPLPTPTSSSLAISTASTLATATPAATRSGAPSSTPVPSPSARPTLPPTPPPTRSPTNPPFELRPGDWPQSGRDPAHTGYNSAETIISPASVAGLSVAWTGTTGNAILSSPAVTDGVVYVGSADGKLYAFALTP
jgi:glucose dehydrogenase